MFVPRNEICNSIMGLRPREEIDCRFSIHSIPKILDGRPYVSRAFSIIGPLNLWTQVANLIAAVSPRIC
ncbi:hypothetical protein V8C26DRAFT_415721 [Trichoderma gracile]